ncbi:hypothetical protein QEN19_003381 [Hanseniaspora menglaensis]
MSHELAQLIKQSKYIQTGFTCDLLKSTFSFSTGSCEYVLSLNENGKSIYIYTQHLQLFTILELDFLSEEEVICVFDVSSSTGNISLATDKSNVFVYNYISLLDTWVYFSKYNNKSTQITCIKWISQQELLVCDVNNMYVYLITENNNFVNLWEQRISGNPIFCIEKLKGTNFFSCLTLNDNLIYIWERTLIDLVNEIYSYKLILLKEDGVSTMNKWSHFDDSFIILYSLTTEKKLNIWHLNDQISKYKSIDLSEKNHEFVIIIPHNRPSECMEDTIIIFGHDFNKTSTIYNIEYVNSSLQVHELEKKINFRSIFDDDLSSTDCLSFNCIYDQTKLYYSVVCDKLNKMESIHFKINMKDIIDLNKNEILEKVAYFTSDVQGMNIIPTLLKDSFLVQTEKGAVIKWSFKNKNLSKEPKFISKENIKHMLSSESSSVLLFEDRIIVNDNELLLERINPNHFILYEDKLFVAYDNQVDVYDLDTLSIIDSKIVKKSKWIFIKGNEVLFLTSSGIMTKVFYESGSWSKENVTNINYDIVSVSPATLDNKFMFETSSFELLIFDFKEMFCYYKRTIDKRYKNYTWSLLNSGQPLIFVNYGDCFNILYHNECTRILNHYDVDSLHIFSNKLIIKYQKYFEIVCISDFENKLQPTCDINLQLIQLIDMGKYEAVKKIFINIDSSISEQIPWECEDYVSNTFNSDLNIDSQFFVDDVKWKESATRLQIKLDEKSHHVLLKIINFLLTEYRSNSVFVNSFKLNINLGIQSFKNVVPLLFEQESLLDIKECHIENINTLADINKYYLPIWQTKDQLYKVFEKVSKTKYMETKNPHDVGIFYLAMGNLDSFKLLWKFSGLKEATKVSKFLSAHNSKTCLNNGYKLLSLHRYKEACWFFLLGNDYKSMFFTAFKRMDFWLLGVSSLRLLDQGNEKLKECLKIYCFDYFYDLKMFWEWFYCGVIINNFNLDFVELDSFYLELDDLLVLLLIIQKYGSVSNERSVANKIGLAYKKIGKHDLSKYYLTQYACHESEKINLDTSIIGEVSLPKNSVFELFGNKISSFQDGSKSKDYAKSISILDQYDDIHSVNTSFAPDESNKNSSQFKNTATSALDEFQVEPIKIKPTEKSLFENSKQQSSNIQQQQQPKSMLDDWM